jgi:hypothetical protein
MRCTENTELVSEHPLESIVHAFSIAASGVQAKLFQFLSSAIPTDILKST